MTMTINIIPYDPGYREQVLTLALAAWTPVFSRTRDDVPPFVFDAFYPDGWQQRQTADIANFLDGEPETIRLALKGETLTGFIGIRLHPDDQMGAISVIAVAPDWQRQGIARQLVDFAERYVREEGMTMIMVETVGDSGHEQARRAYEALGFERWPVLRYFKRL